MFLLNGDLEILHLFELCKDINTHQSLDLGLVDC